jgi:hypothetical protein
METLCVVGTIEYKKIIFWYLQLAILHSTTNTQGDVALARKTDDNEPEHAKAVAEKIMEEQKTHGQNKNKRLRYPSLGSRKFLDLLVWDGRALACSEGYSRLHNHLLFFRELVLMRALR